MSKGFKDPIADLKGKEKKSPWDFTQPKYDERSSCYVNAGTHHGVGRNQPVGRVGGPKDDGVIPKGRPPTDKVAEVPLKNLSIEMND